MSGMAEQKTHTVTRLDVAALTIAGVAVAASTVGVSVTVVLLSVVAAGIAVFRIAQAARVGRRADAAGVALVLSALPAVVPGLLSLL